MQAVCLTYLNAVSSDEARDILLRQFNESLGKDMNQTINALTLLYEINDQTAKDSLKSFYEFWKHDTNAINYWFKLQAAAHTDDVVAKVGELLNDSAFNLSIPNKVQALLGTFIKNAYGYHALSGKGYELVTTVILTLDKKNPSLAARLAEPLLGWDKLAEPRSKMMHAQLVELNEKAVSEDVKNIVKKGLDKAKVVPPLAVSLTLLGKQPCKQTTEPGQNIKPGAYSPTS